MGRLALLIVVAIALAGCSFLTGAPSEDYDIVVGNGTTLVVGVFVNGALAYTYGPGEGGAIPATSLGRLPWAVEARTASGRLLASMGVTAGSTGCTTSANEGACHGVVAMVDLSCGRFQMYTNGSGFSGGPAPGPGTPGDCEP
jgi:hypothetical protein